MKAKSEVKAAFNVLSEILGGEYQFYVVSMIYGIGVSLLTLAIPISVQALVNTVAFTALSQPLIILSLILLSLLIFSGFLNACQVYVLEKFQHKFYARLSSLISIRLVNAPALVGQGNSGADLVNRYFDVMTVQKSMISLLTSGFAIILQTIVGLLLLGLYHPYFIGFNILLILLTYFVWAIFGKNALNTSVLESKSKYRVADWLEELAKNQQLFKSSKRKDFALDKANNLIDNYIKYRTNHFRSVFLQTILLLAIYALMSALLLGLGGFLVLQGELTLGQLVAAEIITTMILASYAKAGKQLESFYDLYAASDKLAGFYGLEIEPRDKLESTLDEQTITHHDLHFDAVKFTNRNHSLGLDYNFKSGEKYFIEAKYYSIKMAFKDLLKGLIIPDKGSLKLGGFTTQDWGLGDWRDKVAVVDRTEFFSGTLKENLSFACPKTSLSKIREILEVTDLETTLNSLPEGLDTVIESDGRPLWPGQLARVAIARALISNPEVLVIGQVFTSLDAVRREKIFGAIKEKFPHMTVIIITTRYETIIPGYQSVEITGDVQIIENKGERNE